MALYKQYNIHKKEYLYLTKNIENRSFQSEFRKKYLKKSFFRIKKRSILFLSVY